MLTKATKSAIAGLVALAGCTGAEFRPIDAAYDEKPEIVGPLAVSIDTAYDAPMQCLAGQLGGKGNGLRFAVGKIEDYTGQNIDSDRPIVTKGAALMAISALGKLGLRQVERFDTSVTELELKYAGQKLLGPGQPERAPTADVPSQPAVPYAQVPAGVVRASDFTIVGGVTELDFNVYSTAFDLRAGPFGRQDRLFAISVGVDLRLVDTDTLAVVETVSLRKQVYGREYQNAAYFGVPFLGDLQVDGSNRERVQEPIQRSVRLVVERAIIDLVADLYRIDASRCLALADQSAPADDRPGQG